MQIQIEYLDVLPFVTKGQRPAIMVKAPLNEIWHFPSTPVLPAPDNPTPQWSYTRGGEIRIELFNYLIDDREPYLALGDIWRLIATISTHLPHERQFVVLGTPFIPQPTGNTQVWFGLALIHKR